MGPGLLGPGPIFHSCSFFIWVEHIMHADKYIHCMQCNACYACYCMLMQCAHFTLAWMHVMHTCTYKSKEYLHAIYLLLHELSTYGPLHATHANGPDLPPLASEACKWNRTTLISLHTGHRPVWTQESKGRQLHEKHILCRSTNKQHEQALACFASFFRWVGLASRYVLLIQLLSG